MPQKKSLNKEELKAWGLLKNKNNYLFFERPTNSDGYCEKRKKNGCKNLY
ncbi:hypothetical protein LCGC14_1593670 [marine sediment metagenome]|uniref:Uncharacterized protein n=1 Tax=marine sediment metagenome TaxID=412755 RepID=A0A0F9IDQ1_9ZZZZ